MNKLLILLLSLIMSIIGCNNHTQNARNNTHEKNSGVLIRNMDQSIRPQDDFYRYVNGQWLNNTSIPADRAFHGTYSILRDQVKIQMVELLNEIIESDHSPGSPEQKIADLYQTYMDVDALENTTIERLAEEFNRIDAIADRSDLSEYMGYADIYSNAPFGFFVFNDDRNSSEYIAYFTQSGLGLPNRDYYLNSDEKSTDIQLNYKTHIKNMLSLAGLAQAEQKSEAIYQLEKTLAENHWDKFSSNDSDKTYNKMRFDELAALLPAIDWDAWLKQSMINRPEFVVVEQPSYFQSLNGIIGHTLIDVWKDYLMWHLINRRATTLSVSYDQEHFNFYKRILAGITEQQPRRERAMALIDHAFNDLLGQLYVQKHFSKESKVYASTLAHEVMTAFADSINDLQWMNEQTRIKALEKLSKVTVKIGHPESWRDFSQLKINRTDLYTNRKEITRFVLQGYRSRLGQPVDKNVWEISPQTVNAYGTPANNEIVIAAGQLQAPFMDLAADDAINYGSIGAVIAHEMGHLFDSGGAKFDGDGNRSDWWDPEDYRAFEERSAQLVQQFNGYTVLNGVHVNGKITLQENMADLTGLTLAYKAFKTNHQDNQIIDGFTPDQRFFIGYAQIWMRKYRDEELLQQINTNFHTPAEFRVNGILRNFPPFHWAFNVQPGDGMYLAEYEIVSIW